MKAKERMLAALHLEKPDRMPATIHQWQDFHLRHFMGGLSDIEAFRETGLDASILLYPYAERTSPNWRVSCTRHELEDYVRLDYTVETPRGNLQYSIGKNEMTSWFLQPLIKEKEDIYLLRDFRPIPVYDKAAFARKYEELGDGGILRTFPCGEQGGCWQDACVLVGTERLILETFDDPDWVHELLEILLQQKLQFVEESLCGARVDLVENGGGAASNTVISPAIHEEFCLPYDKRLHDAIHSAGLPVVYHTCGGMTKILDLILQNGCDASETLSPLSVGGDIATPADEQKVVDTFGGKIAMIGGLDQFNILTSGTPEQVAQETYRLFEAFGKNGGYIASACDHFFHAPKENLCAFAKAAKACVY